MHLMLIVINKSG